VQYLCAVFLPAYGSPAYGSQPTKTPTKTPPYTPPKKHTPARAGGAGKRAYGPAACGGKQSAAFRCDQTAAKPPNARRAHSSAF